MGRFLIQDSCVLVHTQRKQIPSKPCWKSHSDANTTCFELHRSPFHSWCFFFWLSMRAIWKLKKHKTVLIMASHGSCFVARVQCTQCLEDALVRTESDVHT